jgi:CBS-domain-containing membrane protein
MFIQDVMTRDPATVSIHTTTKQAAAVLAERHISAMPVLDREGRLCGVVSEADLIREAFARDPRAHMLPASEAAPSPGLYVADVMTAHALTVHQSMDIADAADLMTSTGVKSLPVIDNHGCLVGVVSRSDLIGVRARSDAAIEREVDSLFVSLGHGDWLVEVGDGTVEIDGPTTPGDRSIAEVAANTVAGVVRVRVG